MYQHEKEAETYRNPSTALLVLDSADRSTATAETGTTQLITQPYNNFRLNKGQNILQGSFTRVQLTEINFPYAIPNVNPRNNSFWIQVEFPIGSGTYLTSQITLPEDNYTGEGLATTLAIELDGDPIVGTAITGYTYPITYVGSTFIITTAGQVANIKLYPSNPAQSWTGGNSLLNVMGFDPLNNFAVLTSPQLIKQSVYAPLTYTKYIDIVSDTLTYFQEVRDGSTKKASQTNIICRLYIADESSQTPFFGKYWKSNTNEEITYSQTTPAGSVPFNIHRQFSSPKTFNWRQNNSINAIDIRLYDDVGELLYYPNYVPDFQITFQASEN